MDKMMFSFAEVARPVTLLAALYSASYEQTFNTDPKYGHGAGAYGEKFGASILFSTSVRVFSDGILASAFHQDPRYYRIAEGSVIHRGMRSAMQALVCRGDDGANQINFSGLGGAPRRRHSRLLTILRTASAPRRLQAPSWSPSRPTRPAM
jgi:hypothetical protein